MEVESESEKWEKNQNNQKVEKMENHKTNGIQSNGVVNKENSSPNNEIIEDIKKERHPDEPSELSFEICTWK
jgi:hypothetical protein